MVIGIEEGKEVGFEKNFKESKTTGLVIPFASEDYVDLVSGDVEFSLKNKCSDFGFKTSSSGNGVSVTGTLKDIKYNFQKRRGEYNKLTIQSLVEWKFVKDGKTLFLATTSGYFINISDKKATISFEKAFNDSISESLDKIFSIEDFRKAFAI